MGIIFLLGFISALALVAGLFFLRSWSNTRDFLFLAFAIFFLAESLGSLARTFMPKPNEGAPWVYATRLTTSALILIAITRKNLGGSR